MTDEASGQHPGTQNVPSALRQPWLTEAAVLAAAFELAGLLIPRHGLLFAYTASQLAGSQRPGDERRPQQRDRHTAAGQDFTEGLLLQCLPVAVVEPESFGRPDVTPGIRLFSRRRSARWR
ncbi:MAG: hypothetical protein ACM3ML_18700 [Micromonosporaceae bacterium]